MLPWHPAWSKEQEKNGNITTFFYHVNVLLHNWQRAVQYTTEASFTQTYIVDPVVGLARGRGAFTPQTRSTRVRLQPYQDPLFKEYSFSKSWTLWHGSGADVTSSSFEQYWRFTSVKYNGCNTYGYRWNLQKKEQLVFHQVPAMWAPSCDVSVNVHHLVTPCRSIWWETTSLIIQQVTVQ